MLTAAALGATNTFRNHILTGLNREQGSNNQVAVRSDLAMPGFQRADAGVRSCSSNVSRSFSGSSGISGPPSTRSSTTIAPTRIVTGGYLRARLDAGKHVVISPGAASTIRR